VWDFLCRLKTTVPVLQYSMEPLQENTLKENI
jgi:hypothetical protein